MQTIAMRVLHKITAITSSELFRNDDQIGQQVRHQTNADTRPSCACMHVPVGVVQKMRLIDLLIGSSKGPAPSLIMQVAWHALVFYIAIFFSQLFLPEVTYYSMRSTM